MISSWISNGIHTNFIRYGGSFMPWIAFEIYMSIHGGKNLTESIWMRTMVIVSWCYWNPECLILLYTLDISRYNVTWYCTQYNIIECKTSATLWTHERAWLTGEHGYLFWVIAGKLTVRYRECPVTLRRMLPHTLGFNKIKNGFKILLFSLAPILELRLKHCLVSSRCWRPAEGRVTVDGISRHEH